MGKGGTPPGTRCVPHWGTVCTPLGDGVYPTGGRCVPHWGTGRTPLGYGVYPTGGRCVPHWGTGCTPLGDGAYPTGGRGVPHWGTGCTPLGDGAYPTGGRGVPHWEGLTWGQVQSRKCGTAESSPATPRGVSPPAAPPPRPPAGDAAVVRQEGRDDRRCGVVARAGGCRVRACRGVGGGGAGVRGGAGVGVGRTERVATIKPRCDAAGFCAAFSTATFGTSDFETLASLSKASAFA